MAIMADNIAHGITAEYQWSVDTGEVEAILSNAAGETIRFTLNDLQRLHQNMAGARNRAIHFRSAQRSLVCHPTNYGLVESAELGGWILPDADPNEFGTPVLVWNQPSDTWDVKLSGLLAALPPRMQIAWNDEERITEMLSYLDRDVLVAEAALTHPDTVSHHKREHDRQKQLREAGSLLTRVKVNIALVKRTLTDAGLSGSGYKQSRYVAGPLHLPGSEAKRAPLVAVVYPRWGRRYHSNAGSSAEVERQRAAAFLTQKMAEIGYNHITATAETMQTADVYSPADPAIITEYAEAIAVHASRLTGQNSWGTAI